MFIIARNASIYLPCKVITQVCCNQAKLARNAISAIVFYAFYNSNYFVLYNTDSVLLILAGDTDKCVSPSNICQVSDTFL